MGDLADRVTRLEHLFVRLAATHPSALPEDGHELVAAIVAGMDSRAEQPPPRATTGPHIHDLAAADVMAIGGQSARVVAGDLMRRKKLGTERYGTPLQAGNGRNALQDAYEEALDLVAYLRQAGEEMGCELGVYRDALAVACGLAARTYLDLNREGEQ